MSLTPRSGSDARVHRRRSWRLRSRLSRLTCTAAPRRSPFRRGDGFVSTSFAHAASMISHSRRRSPTRTGWAKNSPNVCVALASRRTGPLWQPRIQCSSPMHDWQSPPRQLPSKCAFCTPIFEGCRKVQGYPVQIIHAIAALAMPAAIHPIVERCHAANADTTMTATDKSVIEPGILRAGGSVTVDPPSVAVVRVTAPPRRRTLSPAAARDG